MKTFLSLLILLLANAVTGQAVVQIGNVEATSVDQNVIHLKTQNAFIEIIPYSQNIIRFRIDKKPLKKDFSYAVTAKPESIKANISQEGNEIKISTASINCVIQKKPFSVAIYTKDGKVINEDAKGFTTSWADNSVTTYKKMQNGERFIGLGEKSGNLDRKGNAYTNWNTDAAGYDNGTDPLYSDVPFYIGLHDHLSYGIFLDNTYQTDFNFGASNDIFSSFGARGGEMNYYFIYDNSVAKIITDYTWLTGRMKMPPLWSLGYQQSKWSYFPDTMVLHIAHELRNKHFPADGMVLDIDYMDKYQLFTWNKKYFPHPHVMTDSLRKLGFRTTVIVDPGIKIAPEAPAYQKGLKEDVYLKYPNGQYYSGQVWPGWCNFVDFTSEKGRAYWRSQMSFFAKNGVSGVWNDMNEISTWGQRTPNNILYNYDGRGANNLEGHNVYALNMVRSSYEGMKQITGVRPFILSRSGYAGLQRYSAIWTGDNQPNDDHMLLGVRLLNSMGLSGLAFTGMDISGFLGNATPELFTRWMQIGAFMPYCRNHKITGAKPAEPWCYGEDALNNSRSYIELRYHLLPYLYSTFYEATQDGLPVNRSLAIDYTFQEDVYKEDFQNQYLFGNNIMVAPFKSTDTKGKIYLPANDNWYNFYTDRKFDGGQVIDTKVTLDRLPLYIKAGSIIPMQSLIQSTADMPTDTLVLHVYNDNKTNSFTYYEDDGESYRYQKGDDYKRIIKFNPRDRRIEFSKVEGAFVSKFKYVKILLHGFNDTYSEQKQQYFSALPYKISPENKNGYIAVKVIVAANAENEFSIKY